MRTLIIIDVQNDFFPCGALPVPGSESIIPVINDLQGKFDLVIATQDWHPANHMSFASNHEGRKPFDEISFGGMKQVLWPDHCIQGTRGAEFHDGILANNIEAIIRKGMDPAIDSYSGFYDNGHKKNTGLAGYLRAKGSTIIHFCGLAADICVQYTIIDALSEGFSARLISDATWPLNKVEFKTIETELHKMGVVLVNSSMV